MHDPKDLSRRDFGKLSAAALAGLSLGGGALYAADEKTATKNPLLGDPHVCRGLNTCKTKGADKKNSCAGTGTCATAKSHPCGAANECKGQGGCGEKPGENACKGQGDCHVPLAKDAWKKARKRFEVLMKADNKKLGKAPKATAS
jgi:anaerobic selenocysteine-containing dehydrogenase